MFGIFLDSIFVLIIVVGSILGLVLLIYKAVIFIENTPYAAKKKIEKLISAILISHLWLFFRHYSYFLVIFSFISNFLFYQMLEDYPKIQIESPFFISGIVCTLINHFMFLKVLAEYKIFVLEIFFYFAIFVWTTPFCFFLSLGANDDLVDNSLGRKIKRKTYIHVLVERILKAVK